jgi:hypothetical protein
MALLDLSLVTRSLVTLIREHAQSSPAWTSVQPPNVVPQPPDRLEGTDVIGLYLYHVSEDAHYKNLPPPGNDRPPIRYTPMALNLFYQVTPHHEQESDTSTYREQLLLGLAVKALRDYPCIDDTTRINGTDILHADLRGDDNRFRIVLQPIPHNEAVSYWTAGSSPLRLAAYYQVSVILLEPEETNVRSGRVLTYGVHTFTHGAPHLTGSRNTLTFTIPGETDPRTIELQPAAAPYGGRVDFLGSDLAGDETTLVLKHLEWDDSVDADAAWGVAATDDRAMAVVQPEASGRDVLPGIYSARIRVSTHRTMPHGQIRTLANTSNATPFTVSPRIDAVGAPNANGEFTVDGAVFDHPDLETGDVQVYVGDARLTESGGGALNAGEFAISSSTQLSIRLPAGLVPGAVVPLRILVNDAESPPRWVTVP